MFPLTISFEQYSLSEAEISFLWAGINKEETYTAIRWSGSQLTAATFSSWMEATCRTSWGQAPAAGGRASPSCHGEEFEALGNG